ncbi:hypothetical protein NEMIN01_0303 [Nematocida minor]|uniref:uncharacterized protein n=1 Tax=Nematocida minor TaxID=1912983 RepID=UPI00221F9C51|nr:uncharacterized protein NEMIN01_0303 [Nematocida minor]KAI5189137.1 hypothetical protein NEMIN01_0303 [Nematocida minor]
MTAESIKDTEALAANITSLEDIFKIFTKSIENTFEGNPKYALMFGRASYIMLYIALVLFILVCFQGTVYLGHKKFYPKDAFLSNYIIPRHPWTYYFVWMVICEQYLLFFLLPFSYICWSLNMDFTVFAVLSGIVTWFILDRLFNYKAWIDRENSESGHNYTENGFILSNRDAQQEPRHGSYENSRDIRTMDRDARGPGE